jgi:SARP family transcriptional regulator, regulator of embCAB operon
MSDSPQVTRFSILGPLAIERDGTAVDVGGPKQRLLLGLLLLAAGQVVASDRLIGDLWQPAHIDRSTSTLHVSIAKLRRALAEGASHDVSIIETVRPGYRITVDESTLDLIQFRALADRARRDMAGGDLDGASARFREALALRRGELLADLAHEPVVREESVHLERTMTGLAIDAYRCDLRLGRHAEAVAGLGRLFDEHPFDERLCGLLMVAQYRAGRQADALEVARHLREHLADELGVEPGPEISELERRILQHDPLLAAPRLEADVLDANSTLVRSSRTAPTASLRIGDRHIPITRTVTTLGRRRDQAVMVPDPDVSRHHAEIRMTDEGFWLIDIGSTNGTSVDGVRISQHLLGDGDLIQVGSTRMVFEQQQPEAEAESAARSAEARYIPPS